MIGNCVSCLRAYLLQDTESGYRFWGFRCNFLLVLKIVNTKMTLKYPHSTKAVHLSFSVVTFMLAIMVFCLFRNVIYLI